MSDPKITIENICQACAKGPCDEPCKIWYDCLAGKEIGVAELLKIRKRKRRTTSMEEQDVVLKINDHEHEIGSLKHRVKNLEEKQSEISSLTNSVNELAINMRYMLEEQKDQGNRLRKLESEPADNAKYYKRTIITSIITAVAGAIIGAVLALVIV